MAGTVRRGASGGRTFGRPPRSPGRDGESWPDRRSRISGTGGRFRGWSAWPRRRGCRRRGGGGGAGLAAVDLSADGAAEPGARCAVPCGFAVSGAVFTLPGDSVDGGAGSPTGRPVGDVRPPLGRFVGSGVVCPPYGGLDGGSGDEFGSCAAIEGDGRPPSGRGCPRVGASCDGRAVADRFLCRRSALAVGAASRPSASRPTMRSGGVSSAPSGTSAARRTAPPSPTTSTDLGRSSATAPRSAVRDRSTTAGGCMAAMPRESAASGVRPCRRGM